jgi:hypothetical protein
MDSVAVLGVLQPNSRRHHGAPIAALCVVSLVAQAQHQLAPGARDFLRRPAVLLRFSGKPVARQRWTNHVECFIGVAAVRGGIG